MKRLFPLILILLLPIALIACTKDESNRLVKEGIQPYPLTESEENLLRSFGIDDASLIISFLAPEEAITLYVNVYRLDDSGSWSSISKGGISIGPEREPVDQLSGTFTMQLTENYGIDYHINSDGSRASYKTEEIVHQSELTASSKVFLNEFQKIELNKEIPVALMVHSSGSIMRSPRLEEFFKSSIFEGLELVQAVTFTFSDQML